MKKLYAIFSFLLFSTVIMAAPPIQNPSPLTICDSNYDGVETFFLTDKSAEILNGLNPAEYFFSYYADAAHTVPFPSPYEGGNAVVFIRVTEIANPSNFADTLLELVVYLPPVANPVDDLVQVDDPFDGTATFDLTENNIALTGNTPAEVSHYLTQADAEAGTNQLPSSTSFTNMTNPQTIWVRLDNGLGCFTVSNFDIVVVPNDVVYIPDPNLKALLLAADVTNGIAKGAAMENIKVDVNGDGEIQFSEALLVYYLDVHQAGIASMQGIGYFTNLKRMDCFSNLLTALDVSTLTNLELLFCQYNQITSLNITGLSNLVMLHCYNNLLTSLDVTLNANLQNLQCNNNQLMTLNVFGLATMNTLFCEINQLTTLNLTGLFGLKFLSCRNNSLTSLNFSDTINMLELNCNSNLLTDIDVSNMPQLTVLACGSNQLAALNVSSLPALTTLHCNDNILTTLDCSANHNLTYLRCNANQLETLFVKNGSDETFDSANWIENPTLYYICADESQLASLTQMVDNSDVSINSYCTLEPGEDYNIVTGTIRVDANLNGCDASDAAASFIRLDISGTDGEGSVFTNSNGVFTIYTGAGSGLVSVNFENAGYYDLVLPFDYSFAAADGTVQTQDICLPPNGQHFDMEVVVAPIIPARPGFDAVYKILYRNKGNQIQNGAVQFSFPGDRMQLVGSDPVQDSESSGELAYSFSNLQPFQSGEILVTMHVNAPIDTPAVNVGDVLNLSAAVAANGTDETPADNQMDFNQTVVGSFDPNNMICVEGDVVSSMEIGGFLHYIVNFENTGTDLAENIVVVTDINPEDYDIQSLRILDSSDEVRANIKNNRITYYFQDIKLPIGGHGNILLKIRSNNTLTQGDSVMSNADIFFDYNLPVRTNDAQTVFEQLSVPGYQADATISVYPNPTNGIVNIKSASEIRSVEVFDAQGRLLQKSLREASDVTVDVSTHRSGIYFLRITSTKGTKTERIIKN